MRQFVNFLLLAMFLFFNNSFALNLTKNSNTTNLININKQKIHSVKPKLIKLTPNQNSVKKQPIPIFETGTLSTASKENKKIIAENYLAKERLPMLSKNNNFNLINLSIDKLKKTHASFKHYYKSLEVWPEVAIVHLEESGAVYCVNGIYKDVENIDTEPYITKIDAAKLAFEKFPCKGGAKSNATLIIYNWHIEQPILVWKVELKPIFMQAYKYSVFVDAKTGEIINSIDNICTGSVSASTYLLDGSGYGQISAWDDNGTIYLIDASKPMFPGSLDTSNFAGTIRVYDAGHTDTSGGATLISDPNSDLYFDDNSDISAGGTALYYVSKVYDYYYNTHGRNSLDGSGGTITVFVNFRQDNTQGYDNAFWDGQEMIFGDGGDLFSNLAGAYDVCAHELTHGVTEKTCGLVYQFESGALNESMSDVFGVCVDRDDWQVGETIMKTNPQGATALRDVSNPHNGQPSSSPFWQPEHVSELVQLSAQQDNGGVHVNSGIPNKAFYLVCNAIGRDKGEKIYYRGETTYLTPNTDFTMARQAFEQSAIDLYGTNSTEHNAVKSAFDAVGIVENTENVSSDYVLYFPMATNFTTYGKAFSTFIYIVNTENTSADFELKVYESDGTYTAQASGTLAAHSVTGYIMDPSYSSAKVISQKKLIGYCDSITLPAMDNWFATAAAETYSNGLYVPHIGTPEWQWYTLCSITNVANTQSNIIYIDNGDNLVYGFPTTKENQTSLFDFETDVYNPIFGGLPDLNAYGGIWGLFVNYDLNTNEILEPNMVATEVFGKKAENETAGLSLNVESGKTIFFSHIDSTNGWWTGIALVNFNTDPDDTDNKTTEPLKVTAFDSSGNVVKETIVEIAYLGKILQVASSWAVNGEKVIPDSTSWVSVSYLGEGQFLAGFEIFGQNGEIAGLQSAKYVAKKLLFPRIESGTYESNTFWTGVAVINPNQTTANLTFKLYTSTGTLQKTVQATIGPNQKIVGLAKDIFGFSNYLYGWMTVESDLFITGFELYGLSDHRALAGFPVFLSE